MATGMVFGAGVAFTLGLPGWVLGALWVRGRIRSNRARRELKRAHTKYRLWVEQLPEVVE